MIEPFRFTDGQLAYTVKDLVRLCQQSPTDGINYLMREDFEKWLDYIGESDLARKAKEARQASLSEEERLKQFLSRCQPPNRKPSKPSQNSNPLLSALKVIGNFFNLTE